MKPIRTLASLAKRESLLPNLSPASTSFNKASEVLARLFCLALFITILATAGQAQNAATTGDGWVVLPVDEYRALRRSAFPAEVEPASPPVEATLTRIDYDLKV